MVHVSKDSAKFILQYFQWCFNIRNIDYDRSVTLVDEFVKNINGIDALTTDFYSDYRGYSGFKTIFKNKSTKSQWIIFYTKKNNEYWVYAY